MTPEPAGKKRPVPDGCGLRIELACRTEFRYNRAKGAVREGGTWSGHRDRFFTDGSADAACGEYGEEWRHPGETADAAVFYLPEGQQGGFLRPFCFLWLWAGPGEPRPSCKKQRTVCGGRLRVWRCLSAWRRQERGLPRAETPWRRGSRSVWMKCGFSFSESGGRKSGQRKRGQAGRAQSEYAGIFCD